jgi:hypothetical protein
MAGLGSATPAFPCCAPHNRGEPGHGTGNHDPPAVALVISSQAPNVTTVEDLEAARAATRAMGTEDPG